jgi:hypothetical protein
MITFAGSLQGWGRRPDGVEAINAAKEGSFVEIAIPQRRHREVKTE